MAATSAVLCVCTLTSLCRASGPLPDPAEADEPEQRADDELLAPPPAPPPPHGDAEPEQKPPAPPARGAAPSPAASPRRAAAPASPPVIAGKGDRTKEDGQGPSKLALVGKVKECCGYPVGLKESFRLSFYWLAYESEYANENYDTDIYTRDGFWIGRYPEAFVYELKLEGSAIMRDGRILNYDGECNYGMGTCFKALALREHPLGMGAQGRRLVPFRSIAVDPRYIPIGSPVYVPELVGIMMPDGTRHDGCLRADDVGGAIKQHKLDFFVESYFNFKAIGENIWWHLKATPHLEEPRCEYLRLGESRERINDHTDYVEVHRHHAPLARAEKKAAAKVKRNRAIAQAWIKRHRQGTVPAKRAH